MLRDTATLANDRRTGRGLEKLPENYLKRLNPGLTAARMLQEMSSESPSVIKRIAAGNSAAVRECIHQYGGIVWGLAQRMSRTREEAEDATQEIFVAIWQSAARFDDTQGCELIFIAMIARRRLLDRLRRASGESCGNAPSEQHVAEATDPSLMALISREVEQARLTLGRLPAESFETSGGVVVPSRKRVVVLGTVS